MLQVLHRRWRRKLWVGVQQYAMAMLNCATVRMEMLLSSALTIHMLLG
jgi:hypothetical protein